MNPTTPIIIPLQNTITPTIHSQKERKTMKNKIFRNKKEKTTIENKKLHTET